MKKLTQSELTEVNGGNVVIPSPGPGIPSIPIPSPSTPGGGGGSSSSWGGGSSSGGGGYGGGRSGF